jgi:hypothetical protein
LVAAPGHGGKVLFGKAAGDTNLLAELGPELRIRGMISGDLSKLETHNGVPSIRFRQQDRFTWASFSRDGFVPVNVEGGVGHFDFQLEEESHLELVCGGQTSARQITGPVENWEIKLDADGTAPSQTGPAPVREAMLHFEHPPGVPPIGSVLFWVSRSSRDRGYDEREVVVTNGEARTAVPVGGEYSYRPGNLIGYWFADSGMVKVPDGAGPFTVRVPVVPAGAVYIKAWNADGSAASLAGCGLVAIRQPPAGLVGSLGAPKAYAQGDGSRLFIQSSLPLGGTYLAVCNQGASFAVSDPIELTESSPDRRLELRFDRGATIAGRVLPPAGRSLEGASVALDWNCAVTAWSFPATSRTQVDAEGRFSFKDAAPSRGAFSVTVSGAGWQSETVPVDFGKLPLAIQMKPGLHLAGRVVEAKSGLAVIFAQVTASARAGDRWRTEETQTDAQGGFTFDTLWEGDWPLNVGGADTPGSETNVYHPGQTAPVLLKITRLPGFDLRVAEAPGQ